MTADAIRSQFIQWGWQRGDDLEWWVERFAYFETLPTAQRLEVYGEIKEAIRGLRERAASTES